MTYPIETGIPLPDLNSKHNRRWYFPFDEMALGDSFIITSGNLNEIANCRKLACEQRHKTGKRFVSRKVSGGTRFWCVAIEPVPPGDE